MSESLDQPSCAQPLASSAKALSSISDAHSVRDISFFIALVVFAYGLLLYTQFLPFSCILAFLLVARAQNGLMLCGHDALHYLLFKNRKLNDWVGIYLCYAPMGVAFYRARVAHIDHHRFPLAERDEELDLHMETPTYGNFLIRMFAPLFGSYVLKGILRILGRKPGRRARPQYTLSKKNRQADLYAISGSASIMLVLFSLIDWRLYLFFWALPLVTLTAFFHNAKTFLDHASMPGESAGTLYVYRLSLLDRLCFPTQQAAHAGHHLYPYVPYYNLPKLAAYLQGQPGVLFRKGYFATLREYARRLKGLESKPQLIQ